MLEEEKVVEAEAVKEEEAPVEAVAVAEPIADAAPAAEAADTSKNALIAFILALVALCLGWEPFASVVGIVLSAIALKQAKIGANTTKKPFNVFVKIAKPVAIVMLIASIIMTVVWAIYGIVLLAAAGCAAAMEAASSSDLVLLAL